MTIKMRVVVRRCYFRRAVARAERLRVVCVLRQPPSRVLRSSPKHVELNSKICEKVGMKKEWSMKYSEFVDDAGQRVFFPRDPHHTVTVYIKNVVFLSEDAANVAASLLERCINTARAQTDNTATLEKRQYEGILLVLIAGGSHCRRELALTSFVAATRAIKAIKAIKLAQRYSLSAGSLAAARLERVERSSVLCGDDPGRDQDVTIRLLAHPVVLINFKPVPVSLLPSLHEVVPGVDVVRLLLAALVAGVLGVELAIAVVLTALMVVIIELVLFVELILVIFVVVAWKSVVPNVKPRNLHCWHSGMGPPIDGGDTIPLPENSMMFDLLLISGGAHYNSSIISKEHSETVSDNTRQPIYVPLLGTGLLSEQEGLGDSFHAGPVRIGNFTRTIELLRSQYNHHILCPFPSPHAYVSSIASRARNERALIGGFKRGSPSASQHGDRRSSREMSTRA
ncbi:hypothetical protein MSG28_001323 [Choristoneura fumiferana]|uniref:Uncharacterized protein n=1 Tax=Choristoneura fumiferana TaxID=7141 RepID=A0ACC0KU57_CHOFU|nr:hypothetical protein MSG28_001323 [Choristoneura fumiferana]